MAIKTKAQLAADLIATLTSGGLLTAAEDRTLRQNLYDSIAALLGDNTFNGNQAINGNVVLTGSLKYVDSYQGTGKVLVSNSLGTGTWTAQRFALVNNKIGDIVTQQSLVGAGGIIASLYSYNLPANTLINAGDKIKIKYSFKIMAAGSTLNCSQSFTVGGTAIAPAWGGVGSTNSVYDIEAIITRITQNTQICEATTVSNTGVVVKTVTDLTLDLSTALAIVTPLTTSGGSGTNTTRMVHAVIDYFGAN